MKFGQDSPVECGADGGATGAGAELVLGVVTGEISSRKRWKSWWWAALRDAAARAPDLGRVVESVARGPR